MGNLKIIRANDYNNIYKINEKGDKFKINGEWYDLSEKQIDKIIDFLDLI